MHHNSQPFSIPAIRDSVPAGVKPWILVLMVIVFQFSGGVYLAAVSEMVGGMALMQEDILMAGYASLVGLALTFAIVFRLRFRFPSKFTLLLCSAVIIAANIICMHTRCVPVLVATCFIAGFFRMWATFECNSTIQLWITPKRDMSIFFCYIYLLVQGCIELSGLTTIYTAAFAKWEYMHWLVIGLLLLVMLAVLVLFCIPKNIPKVPLYGVDWLGGLMWGLIALVILFIFVYGDHYDWYESSQICIATVAAILLLSLNLWRASFIRHPYISLQVFKYPIVPMTLSLYIVTDLLLSPSHLFEHIYMEAILKYDSLHIISLNWIIFVSTIAASIFCYFTFAKRKWRYKKMITIAYMAIAGYLLYFYLLIDYNLPKEMLFLPLFLRNFGYVIVAICFLTSLTRVPFNHFFQCVTMQNIFSAAIAAPIGTAILGVIFNHTVAKNLQLLSLPLDSVNSHFSYSGMMNVYGALQQQVLMVSMKEIYGILTIACIICMLLFMLRESDLKPYKAIHPSVRALRRLAKHNVRIFISGKGR